MSVQWIRDVDTGELYPVQNDFDYETPAHLETPEYQTVDYDKTRQMTIEQLQNQLIAAQNHIEAIENEKISDNNSIETVNDVSAEVVSESGFKNFWDEFYLTIILVFICASLVVFGAFVFRDKIKEALQHTAEYQTVAEQQTVDYEVSPFYEMGSIPIYSTEQGISLYLNRKEQEPPQEQQETEQEQSEKNVLQYCLNFALRFLPIIVTVLGFKLGIHFVMNVMRGP